MATTIYRSVKHAHPTNPSLRCLALHNRASRSDVGEYVGRVYEITLTVENKPLVLWASDALPVDSKKLRTDGFARRIDAIESLHQAHVAKLIANADPLLDAPKTEGEAEVA